MYRVALYYPMRLGLWRNVLRGIFEYARPNQRWVFSLAAHEDPLLMLKWNPDAIIGQLDTPKAVDALRGIGIPVVDTSYSYHDLGAPRLRFDDVAIGSKAARYLMDRGFTNFAFAGSNQVAFELDRRRGFEETLHEQGFECLPIPELARAPNRPDDLGPLGGAMNQWLKDAPRPLAIFAAVDPLALRLSEACLALDLRVPEDVALLGVNDDELICNLAWPPLSSVRLPARKLGFEAARLLDHWFTTGKAPLDPPALGVADIVTRQSTDIYATSDPVLNEALRYIREHAHRRLSVGEVVDVLDVSRSSLERRFKAILRRSPLDEIRRVQVGSAKKLLLETNETMPEIARASGFRDGKHFATAFRASVGMTPSEFRKNR